VKADRNTEFFHQAIIKRHRKNTISHLRNPDGSHSTTPAQLSNTLINYFKSIFSSSTSKTLHQNHPFQPPTPQPPPVPNSPTANSLPATWNPLDTLLPQPTHTNQQDPQPSNHANGLFNFTHSTPDLKELHDILTKMRSNAAPGPDGLNVAFYKASWNWVKEDIHDLVKDFYTHVVLPSNLNQTYITLIPKKSNPTIPQYFRPIGLCNVIYKIIVKSLDNRVNLIFPNTPLMLNQLSLLTGISLLISS
jgi:hypothetical protein